MSATQRFRVAAIPADGVGREVVAAGREVSSVTKSNAQQYGMVLRDDVFRRVTRDLGGAASTDDVTKALIDALNP